MDPSLVHQARARRGPRLLCAVASVLALGLSGCTGELGGGSADGEPGAGSPGAAAEQVAERSLFPRLSHTQWENTVRDLLRLDAPPGLSASFTTDPLGGVFDNNEFVLQVTPGLWGDYQRAAEELAGRVVSDAGLLSRVVPADLPAEPDAKARAFIASFGLRAYRRPLADGEIDALATLFARGRDLYDAADPFGSGVRTVIEAVLQSPQFVYRVELGGEPRKDGLIPLSGYEIATKLSYLLWNTMPSDDLLEAARAGELSSRDAVRAYAERMLQDPRAHDVVGSFHRQLYDYKKYHDLNKDNDLYPEFVPEMGDDMQREAERFVEHIVFDKEGGLTDLLTARTAFVNDHLAVVYGLQGQFSGELTQVELDPAQRSGMLTRLGFLAANGTARQPDSIHRGVFINLRILCAALPPPPDNATALPPGDQQTNRERVSAHTGKGTCGASCHGTMINPAGFAFERYDAIGKYRTEDNGFPINSADAYVLGGETRTYEDAVQFSQVLAESAEAHACYAKHWIEFAYGRDVKKQDTAMIRRLGEASRGGASTQELILDVLASDAFLTRAPLEAQ